MQSILVLSILILIVVGIAILVCWKTSTRCHFLTDFVRRRKGFQKVEQQSDRIVQSVADDPMHLAAGDDQDRGGLAMQNIGHDVESVDDSRSDEVRTHESSEQFDTVAMQNIGPDLKTVDRSRSDELVSDDGRTRESSEQFDTNEEVFV